MVRLFLCALLALASVSYGQQVIITNDAATANAWNNAMNLHRAAMDASREEGRRNAAALKAEQEMVARMTPEQRTEYFAQQKVEAMIADAKGKNRFKVGLFVGNPLTKEQRAYNEKIKKMKPKDRPHLTLAEQKRLRSSP